MRVAQSQRRDNKPQIHIQKSSCRNLGQDVPSLRGSLPSTHHASVWLCCCWWGSWSRCLRPHDGSFERALSLTPPPRSLSLPLCVCVCVRACACGFVHVISSAGRPSTASPKDTPTGISSKDTTSCKTETINSTPDDDKHGDKSLNNLNGLAFQVFNRQPKLKRELRCLRILLFSSLACLNPFRHQVLDAKLGVGAEVPNGEMSCQDYIQISRSLRSRVKLFPRLFPPSRVCMFITAGPIQKLCAGRGGRTCAES